MPIKLKSIALVCTVAAVVVGGAVAAQSSTETEAAIAKAVAAGTLKELVVALAKTNTCEFVARAMLNEGVSYEDAIAALLEAKLPADTVSRCLYGSVAPSELASLDRVLILAGLPLAETGAGPVNNGPSGSFPGLPAPFVGSTGSGGGGNTTASKS